MHNSSRSTRTLLQLVASTNCAFQALNYVIVPFVTACAVPANFRPATAGAILVQAILVQAILAQVISSQGCLCSRGTGELHFCSCVDSVMVRKGWTKVEVRGNRPPSVGSQQRETRQRQVRCQPAARVPGSIEGARDPSIIRSFLVRGQRGAAGIAHNFGEGQTTSPARRSIWTEQRGVAQSRTRPSLCGRVRRWRRLLEEVEDTSCRSDFVGANRGFCWRSGLAPAGGRGFATTVAATCRSGGPYKGCFCGPINLPQKREDDVPATEHEVLEWMTDRQEEMTAGLMARNQCASVHGLQHSSVRIAQEARTISRYGLPRSRVGEASNPGPFADSAAQSRIGQSPVSSDEELLVHTNTGRDVLPRDPIQQTLIDTELRGWDGSLISVLEADLVGNVVCDPISAVRGPRHQGASRRGIGPTIFTGHSQVHPRSGIIVDASVSVEPFCSIGFGVRTQI